MGIEIRVWKKTAAAEVGRHSFLLGFHPPLPSLPSFSPINEASRTQIRRNGHSGRLPIYLEHNLHGIEQRSHSSCAWHFDPIQDDEAGARQFVVAEEELWEGGKGGKEKGK